MKRIFTHVISGILLLLFVIAFYNRGAAQTLISQGKTCTASTTETGYTPNNATDGSMGTIWSSTNSSYNEWLYIDLGATYDIASVNIYWADGRYASTFDVMTSTNGTTWTTVYTKNGNTNATWAPVGGLHSMARYVKFNGRGRANLSGYRIAELKVYGTVPNTTSQQNDLNTLTGRLLAIYSNPTDETSLMNSMQPDGHWSNLTYTTGGTWPSHSLRINEMAQAWANSSNVSYHDSVMLSKIVLGIGYLVRTKPKATNWWDTVVRVPNNLLVALMVIKGHINTDTLYKFSDYILDHTDNPNNNGMNQAWVAENLIRKGLVVNRYPVTDKGFSVEASALEVVAPAGSEGVMIDNSFHQHGDELYTGGYGRNLVIDEANYLKLSAGTALNSYFTSTYQTNLSNLYLGGALLLSYRGVFDFGTVGRGISRADALITIPTSSLDTMKLNDPTNASVYQAWKDHISGADYPSAYQKAKYYWKSPILVSHGPNWYMSARIISSRSRGAEYINGENSKGYNLPLGATNIMVTGNEYNNIFPSWKWSRVPGTTTEKSEAQAALTGYFNGTNTFGGGLSVNEAGAIAFQDNYKGVTANKAYVFMEGMMLCVGNNIRSSQPNEIITNIEQSLTNGTISYNDGTTHTFTTDSMTTHTIQWVHHNNIGYMLPLPGSTTLMNKTQSGSWHDINSSQSSTVISNQVFSFWVDHDVAPTGRSYYYIVVPNKALADMPAAYAGHGFSVPINNTTMQAIRNDLHQQYAVIFYAAGTADMGDGLTITSDKPAIVLIRVYTTSYRVSVADPNYNQSAINITLNRNLSGTGAVYTAPNTTLAFTMPTDDNTGKTVTNFYSINTTSLTALSTLQTQSLNQQPADQIGISVYPNPAGSVINVRGLIKPADIDVYNLTGHKFKTVHGTAVDVSELSAGVTYFLRIHTNGNVISRQFIKN